MQLLKSIVESNTFQRVVIAVIVINAITLGLETSPTATAFAGDLLSTLDRAALIFFVFELTLKLLAYRLSFFRAGWNVFDFLVIGVAVISMGDGMAVLRTLRFLRALRLISAVPSMRKVVGALLRAVPGMTSVLTLLLLVFYVAAVMSTRLFGASFPDWFGSLGASFYSLFQIMTLESWSMGIVRPVMEVYSFAWLFFIAFILSTTFAVMNLFVAILVDAMSAVAQKEEEETRERAATEHTELMAELRGLRAEIAELRQAQAGKEAAPA